MPIEDPKNIIKVKGDIYGYKYIEQLCHAYFTTKGH